MGRSELSAGKELVMARTLLCRHGPTPDYSKGFALREAKTFAIDDPA